MADFNKSFIPTLVHEGGYANDPDDRGGETYRGIARKFHPNWLGWVIVDSYKNKGLSRPDLNAALKSDATLNDYVKQFYKVTFWDRGRLSEINNQDIANEVYDTGVNFGIGKSIKFLQEAVNHTDRNANLDEDGLVGSKTISAVNNHKDPAKLFKTLNIIQGAAYLADVRNNPVQEKYWNGWINRVTFL